MDIQTFIMLALLASTTQAFNAGLAYADYRQAQVFYIIAALAAFLMSSYFMISFSTGGVPFEQWGAIEWKYAVTAVMVTGVMTGFQFRLYAAGKTKAAGRMGVVAVVVAVSFSLLSEVGQSMERDETRMEMKSQESPTYQAAVAALNNLSGGNVGANPYSAEIASAQMKYNQCLERLAKGREPHCEGSKGRLEAYKQQAAEWAENQQAVSTSTATALLDKAKTLEKDESNYFPLVGVIAEHLGVSGKTASLIFSAIIISMFEFAFHYLGGDFNRARAELMKNGYDVTRRLRQPPRKHDGSIETYQEQKPALSSSFADSWDSFKRAAPVKIASEMNRAQHARDQVRETMGDKAEQWGNTIDEKLAGKTTRQLIREGKNVYPANRALDDVIEPAKPAKTERMPLKDQLAQIHTAVKTSGANSPADIKQAVTAAYLAIPNPTPMDARMLTTVARNIAKQTASTAQPAFHASAPKPNGTGRHNPALGTAEEYYEMPLSSAPSAREDSTRETRKQEASLETGETRKPLVDDSRETRKQKPSPVTKEAREQAATATLYEQWKQEVFQPDGMGISKAPCEKFIRANADATGFDGKTITRIWNNWLDRAHGEGLLVQNESYDPNAKNRRVPRYKKTV